MRIAIVSLSPILRDARVQRSARALCDAGHDVLVVARGPFPTGFEIASVALPEVGHPGMQRAALVLGQAPATFVSALAEPLYWSQPAARAALAAVLAHRPDAVFCNDWNTLPVGAAARRRPAAALIYDSHEFATREHVQNWKWRLVSQRAVEAIERRHIRDADLVLTVSDGIADALGALYGLPARPTVIRNTPTFREIAERPIGDPPVILFHGVIRPERGLEELVDSMPRWTAPGRLLIRGYGQQGYLAALAARAAALGLTDRVAFAPKVGPEELIDRAAESDIGYLALPGTTEQYEFALPNKLFEYLMAGLPILATRRADMARVIDETGTGVFCDLTPASIAAALDALTPERLAVMRRAALAAARSLNWEHERARLVEAVAAIRPGGRGAP